MNDPFVLFEKGTGVVTLTLNRPSARNAVGSHSDCQSLVDAIASAQADPNVSCIILTGAGSAFCAGGDLQGMRDRNGLGPLESPAATRTNYRRGVQALVRSLWECEIPLVAAINGHAIGFGLDLACLCDIRLAADGATFGSTFIKMGLVPGDGGAWILPRVVGWSVASEMLLTGKTIDTTEAIRCGLISRVVSAEGLLAEARSLAATIAANPAAILRLTKRLLRESQHARLSDALELSAAYQALAHETRDHAEALSAFFERRKPQFTGK